MSSGLHSSIGVSTTPGSNVTPTRYRVIRVSPSVLRCASRTIPRSPGAKGQVSTCRSSIACANFAISDGDDDLAPGVTVLDPPERVDDLVQRIPPIDHRPQLA